MSPLEALEKIDRRLKREVNHLSTIPDEPAILAARCKTYQADPFIQHILFGDPRYTAFLLESWNPQTSPRAFLLVVLQRLMEMQTWLSLQRQSRHAA